MVRERTVVNHPARHHSQALLALAAGGQWEDQAIPLLPRTPYFLSALEVLQL